MISAICATGAKFGLGRLSGTCSGSTNSGLGGFPRAARGPCPRKPAADIRRRRRDGKKSVARAKPLEVNIPKRQRSAPSVFQLCVLSVSPLLGHPLDLSRPCCARLLALLVGRPDRFATGESRGLALRARGIRVGQNILVHGPPGVRPLPSFRPFRPLCRLRPFVQDA